MKGLIFAAGVGSRLKPWTDHHPKALAEVGGKPVLGRVIDRMLAAGITSIVVNVHHFAGQIVDYLHAAYADIDLAISDETGLLLETGGGLSKALPLIGYEPVLIHNADVVSDLALRTMIDAHAASGADVTLLVQPRETTRHFLFRDNRLVGWNNAATGQVRPADLLLTPPPAELAFGGVHIVGPAAFGPLKAYRPVDVPFSITDFYIDNCRTLDIGAFRLPAGDAWFDIGKPETLEKARSYFQS